MKNDTDQLVSIIIPCFNKACYVSDAIESALNQTYQNIECIIVDDGSTDNTETIVNKYREKDKRVRYFYTKNQGVGSARNYGVRKANGSWIQFLDADDWLNADKINFQLKYLENKRYPNGVVLYSDYKIIYQDMVGKDAEFTFEQLDNQELIKKVVGLKFGLTPPATLHVNNCLFSKALFDFELFDETVPAYEDFMLFYNLLVKNVSFLHTPCIGMSYRSNPGGISKVLDNTRIGYLRFLELVFSTHKHYLEYSPNILTLIRYFVRRHNKELYNRTLFLIRNSDIPVYSNDNKNIRKLIIILDRLKFFYPLMKYIDPLYHQSRNFLKMRH